MADLRSDKVRVEGLREVQKALRNADKELAKLLGQRQKKIAADIIDKTESAANTRGGATGKAARAGAYRAVSDQRAAKVQLLGDRFPYALGGEFGAKQYPQFERWRGNQFTDPLGQNVGYALFPTLRKNRDHIINQYDDLLDDLLHRLAKIV
jgi:hypothetical protein